MIYLLTTLHVIFCLFLILVILLQTGKGGGMGVAFGGSGSAVFGPRGAGSFIGKMTGTVAILFMVSSLVLAYMSSSKSSGLEKKASLMDMETGREEVDLVKELSKNPATPPAAAPAPAQEEPAPADVPAETPEAPGTPEAPAPAAPAAAPTPAATAPAVPAAPPAAAAKTTTAKTAASSRPVAPAAPAAAAPVAPVAAPNPTPAPAAPAAAPSEGDDNPY